MSVQLAGRSSDQYKNRCDYDLRCICYERGDRNVFINGQGPYCIIIDREDVKIEIEDVGVQSSSIEAVWVESDCIPIKKGAELVSGGYKYKFKESPVTQHDGWMKAKLQLRCAC